MFCNLPGTSNQVSENHLFLSSQKKALEFLLDLDSGLSKVRLGPFRKIKICSCSSVTCEPTGYIPDPMNLFGALVDFRHIMDGKDSKPIDKQELRILE